MKRDEFILIKKFLNTDEEFISQNGFEDNDQFYYFENMDNGVVLSYLIYFCNGNRRFVNKEYNNIVKKIENSDNMSSFFTPVFVFDNLNEETNQYEKEYQLLKNATERKALRELFERKQSIYTSAGVLSLSVEDNGINYLEYLPVDYKTKNIKGYEYNISYHELEKLFNVKGRDLFRENIRYGLTKENATKKKLGKRFEKYFRVGVYTWFLKRKLGSNEKDKLIRILGLEDEGDLEQFNPQIFWFKHNGVTVFIMDDEIDRTNDTITFDSNKVSIINVSVKSDAPPKISASLSCDACYSTRPVDFSTMA